MSINVAMSAARRIIGKYTGHLTDEYIEDAAAIIEAETHEAEMIAFIERVASWDYPAIIRAQEEAFVLLKKVRG